MIVRKSYKYWLKLTKKQKSALQEMLDECRWLYNLFLEQRILAYEELEISLSKYQQLMFLPLLKEERPSLTKVHSQVLQDVVVRLDRAFEAFFRRCSKGGEKPGFPRFRGYDRYDSFTYPQSGFEVVGSELKLSKIGPIRMKQHRPIFGAIKTCTLRRDPSGKWYASLSVEQEAQLLVPNEKSVGIDMGIEHWAHLSDGTVVENPRFLKQEEKALAKAQRKLSKFEKRTPGRRKQGKIVAKVHERIRNKRQDFCHKQSKKIVAEYQYICVEELNIKNMVEGSPLGSSLSRSIADASWNQFCRFLAYKAGEAGRKVGMVNPAYTSATCSQCGKMEKKSLSHRQHQCTHCGYSAHRDFNAAQNILAIGLDSLGLSPRSLRL